MTDQLNIDLERYGAASLLPGLVYLRDVLSREITQLQERMSGSNGNGHKKLLPVKKATVELPVEPPAVTHTAAKPKQHYQAKGWTPERRKKASEALKKVHAERFKEEQKVKGRPVESETDSSGRALKVGRQWTSYGIAQELGIHANAVNRRARNLGLKAKMIGKIAVYTNEQAAIIRRNGKPPKGMPSTHPSNPDHPDHAGWIQRATAARMAKAAERERQKFEQEIDTELEAATR